MAVRSSFHHDMEALPGRSSGPFLRNPAKNGTLRENEERA
jgi:hypothetical protein